MRTLSVVALVIAFATFVSARTEDQQPGTPQTGEQGMLRINSDYFDLAAATGGDFYFWGPGEFAAANLEVPRDGDDVVLSYGPTTKQPDVYDVPVESGARALVMFCGAQRKDLCVLVRPDGTAVRPTDEGVRHQSYRFMTIVFVPSPQPGKWTIQLDGAGIHEVSARIVPGDDAPSFDRFAFVEMRGRPGHEGWFEIDRPLKSGETLDCQADVDGNAGALSFSFVDRSGTPIAPVTLERSDDGYLGRCTAPSVPFRVVVTGNDRLGVPFRRITSHLAMPEN